MNVESVSSSVTLYNYNFNPHPIFLQTARHSRSLTLQVLSSAETLRPIGTTLLENTRSSHHFSPEDIVRLPRSETHRRGRWIRLSEIEYLCGRTLHR